MKKLFLLISFVAMSTIGFTQNKGEKYIVTTANVSFGNLLSEITDGYQSVSSEKPLSTNIGIGAGFGYFVAKNFRIELCLSGYVESNPAEKLGEVWLKDKYKGFGVNPNLSYFVKLAEGFYYTPEVGVSIGWGKNTYEQSINQSTNYNYNDYAFYVNLLAFQCRVSHSFALGIVVGDVSYRIRDYNINANINDGHYNVHRFIFNLNSGGIFAHFYF
ncbi:MAG: hypothetical protein J6W84_05585 [Bacteroidales bacterium]|nr:hypothetical protein [Bacteroidales bacterium]